ncbi:recombination protein F [Erythrobacter sp. SDW2]|nr:recombination protein F [Erythrobacter sp. SDW2]UIP07910.1 recombination protein F [Erythrobacter sp. SDW2]
MFDLNNAGSRLFAALSALAISSLVMAFAIIPGSPAGVIA